MKLLLGVVAMFALGCGSKSDKSNTEDKTEVKDKDDDKGLCKKPGAMCGTYACGGNSAIVNAFPINGWRAGECVHEGSQVVKESLDGPCQGQTLDIKNGKLVGLTKDGKEGCVEGALKGASFEVGGIKKGTERILIADVNVDWVAPNGTKRTAYKMEWVEGPNHWGLCSKDGDKLRKKLGLEVYKDHEAVPAPTAPLVIPLVGEVYGDEGQVVHSDVWNHLACVDDALAKRSLYQLESTDKKKNRAALRMLTADYCGSTAWTVRGEWIEWGNTNGLNVEAQWNDKGATCLTAPRLLRDDNDQPVLPPPNAHLKHLCKYPPGGCKTIDDYMKEMRTCRKIDGTVDHELLECKECSDPSTCPPSSKNAKHP